MSGTLQVSDGECEPMRSDCKLVVRREGGLDIGYWILDIGYWILDIADGEVLRVFFQLYFRDAF